VTLNCHPTTWEERQSEFVRREIEVLLASLSDSVGFNDLVKEALTKNSSSLSARTIYVRQWALLPLMVCESVGGHYEQALPASAAIQLLMAAGEVFDDIEDADSSESLSGKYGSAVATNIATTLLILAERAITLLKGRGVADCNVVRVMDAVNSLYAIACAGQHLDLTITPEMAVSEDTYLRIACMKSASTPECACHIGALLATENQELIDKFTIFGRNLGMASQIANDIQGIIRGSDIVKRKITLPMIYALTQTEGEARNQLKLTFVEPSELVPDPRRITDLLFHYGAIHYATIKMELYKQHALDILSEVKSVGASVERLKLFLE